MHSFSIIQKLYRVSVLLVLLLVVSCFTVDTASAQIKVEDGKMFFGPELVDFYDLSLKISEFSKVNVIISDKIKSKGKFYVLIPDGMNPDEAWQNYLSILGTMGVTFKTVGQYKTAADSTFMARLPAKVYIQDMPKEDTSQPHVTVLYTVNNIDTAEATKFIAQFKTKEGKIFSFENKMIFVELQTHLPRLLNLLKEIDSAPSKSKIYYWAAKNSPIDDVSSIVEQLFLSKKSEVIGLEKIVTDERTNGMFIIGDEEVCKNVLQLLPRLDIGLDQVTRMEVIFLQFAKAEEMLTTLNQITNTRGRKSSKKHDFGDDLSMNLTVDKSNNAIVVVGSPRGIKEIKRLVKKLDRFPRQILMEVVVLEVTIGDDDNTGVALTGARNVGYDDTTVVGGSNFGALNSIAIDPTSLMGVAFGVRGPDVTGSGDGYNLGMDFPKFSVLVRMLQQNSNVDVISNPYLMGMDAEDAEIIVGSNIPFVTGTSRDSNNNPILSIQRQDVAMTLKLKPSINEKGRVKIKIEVGLEDLASMSETMGPTTTKRAIKTTVMGSNGSRIAIGGLLRENEIEDTEKVPVLGELPILGHLFRNTKNAKAKTNLMVVITPHILNDPEDIRRVFKKKLKDRSEYIREMYGEESEQYDIREGYHDRVGVVEIIHQVILEQKSGLNGYEQEQMIIITPLDVSTDKVDDEISGDDVEYNPPPPPEEDYIKPAPPEQN